jgi:4-carboxymuconolactone decarboxylase
MTTAPPPRIAPLQPPYAPEIAQSLAKWMPPGSDAEPLALFRTLHVHGELASRMRPLGAGILGHGLLEPRLREVMILRTCALCGAEYEWGVHAQAFGRSLGFSDEQLASTIECGARGARGAEWSAAERAVFALADELHETSDVGDALFAELREHFDDAQIIELVVTSGWYHTISYVIAAARVQPEPWAARFADAGRPPAQPTGAAGGSGSSRSTSASAGRPSKAGRTSGR